MMSMFLRQKENFWSFPRFHSAGFCLSIHTDVGHSCVGAKINGKIVPLRYNLHSGDTVEIITSKKTQPHKDWLSFVALEGQGQNQAAAAPGGTREGCVDRARAA